MAKRNRDKIEIERMGTKWYWAYCSPVIILCPSAASFTTRAKVLRAARRFAAKFIDPPPIVDQKE